MASTTTYSIFRGETELGSKSKKGQAIEAADVFFAEDTTQGIQVRTNAGTVVHEIAPKGTHSKPWTRVQEHELDLEVPAGYTVAYTRSRVGALVARADDKSGWVVITADGVTEVTNTTEARELTNALAVTHREKQAEAREQADAAKAELKAAKAKERAEAKAAKDAEKAEKAAAKEQAKAEKAAAEAAKADEPEAADVA